jgi:glucosamine--fructose-6-phosphate aminotransferase (isomerizing)
MCGIFGYVGARDAAPLVLAGLKRLEYRGYDSAGLAVVQRGRVETRKEAGKLGGLIDLVARAPLAGTPGIGHTRWATHGLPTAENAHPHAGSGGRVVVVQNGIVENWLELRRELEAGGTRFVSDTDTEALAHLVERNLAQGLGFEAAVRATCRRVRGANVLVFLSADSPDLLVAARLGNAGGLVIGLGADGNFVASDAAAVLPHTRRVLCIEDGQVALVAAAAVSVSTLEGTACAPVEETLDWDLQAAEKNGHPHFMHKEMHEQPQALRATLAGRVDAAWHVDLPELRLTSALARQLNRIVITGCGTALYAGMVGKYLLERLARVPVEVIAASELRHADPVLDAGTAVLAISQSGETVDMLGAMAAARERGAVVWSIVNAPGSQAMRSADGHVAMRCGPELGVASTKAFTTPLLDLYLLAVSLASLRGVLPADRCSELLRDLQHIPSLVTQTLAREPDVLATARALRGMTHCLYMGRGPSLPVALEGALKLKELAYVHAEGLAAGELKHGPIALVEPGLPLVCVAPRDPWRDKVLAQIQQVRARHGSVVAVATDGDTEIASLAAHVLWVPEVPWLLSPLVTVLPLQLLAYHSAVLRGHDIDQPRNLAKSVTVE